MPNLIILSGAHRGQVLPIRGNAILGRGPGVELQVPDVLVSSRHAELQLAGEGYVLRDLGSTNGTFVNGTRVSGPVTLAVDDLLHVGTTELLFTERSSLDETHTPADAQPRPGAKAAYPSYEVRLLADTQEELLLSPSRRGAGLTTVLPLVHETELDLSKARDLTSLLERVALHFAQGTGGKAVLIVLDRDGQSEVMLRARVEGKCLHLLDPDETGFQVHERLIHSVLEKGGACLARVDEAGGMAFCLGLPHAHGIVGAIYLDSVRASLEGEDLRPLILLANMVGVHCRAHLLVDELRERNAELEEARTRLASWNEELQAAVEARTAELARSEANYRSLFHESRDGNFTLDRDGRIRNINRTAAMVLDVDAGEALGQPIWHLLGEVTADHLELLMPDGGSREVFAMSLDALAANQNPDLLQFPVQTLRGRQRTVELLLRPMVDADETIAGLHGIVRDVTSRHEAEKQMRLLSRIVENVKEAVVTTTLDGTVTSWNPGAEALYGYQAEEVLRQFLPTVPDEREAELERILSAVAQGRSLAVRSERLNRDDQVIPVLATFAPVSAPNGRIVGVIELARDLSEQLGLEERMRWRERLASFGELAAGLAHELGNPLANLASGVEFLLDRPRDPEEARESLELLRNEIERLLRLVQQTLDLARWEPPLLGPVDPGELLTYAEAMFKEQAQERELELVLEPGQVPLRVLGDLDQLKQALLNLVSNAFKATPPGGRVELSVIREGDEAGLEVSDTGRGIPPGQEEKVFDLFQTCGRQDGSGIGLAVVKRIVDLHQGRIELASEPEVGTTFRLLLPVAPAPAEAVNR